MYGDNYSRSVTTTVSATITSSMLCLWWDSLICVIVTVTACLPCDMPECKQYGVSPQEQATLLRNGANPS